MIRTLLIVALGGGIGSALRFAVSHAVQEWTGGMLPWHTLAVNVAGCLLIGLFYGLADGGRMESDSVKTLLTTGLCGGFTTFSTFCNENVALARGGHAAAMLLYTGGSIALGMAAVAAGYCIAALWR